MYFHFCAIIFLAHLDWALLEDPLWFPDLMCHPGAQEGPFVYEGEEHKGVGHYRELAKECKGFEKNDPCLKMCVLDKWGLVEPSRLEYPPEIYTNKIGLLMADISNGNTGFERKMSRSDSQCQRYHPDTYDDTVSGKLVFWWECSDAPLVIDCMEALLNCSLKSNQFFDIPPHARFLDFSCHPNTVPVGDPGYTSHSAEISPITECRHRYPKDEFCFKACFIYYYIGPFFYEYKMYKVGTPDSLGVIDNLGFRLPGFIAVNGDLDQKLKNQMEVAEKLLEKCAPLFTVTDDNINTDPSLCAVDKEKFRARVECVENFMKCKA